VLRPALAVALPAFGLAWCLSQMDLQQRSGYVAALRAAALRQMPANAAPLPVPAARTAQELGTDSFAIDADASGQYRTTMLVAGRHLPALIDTGATFVALTYEDAASIGIHPVDADFKYQVQTANGTSRVAAATLSSVRVGNVEARNVQALVSPPGSLTGHSLLGMSFLKQLSGFEIQSGRLVLRQ
jgi:aspartyl protease family protein